MSWEFHVVEHALQRDAVCNNGTPATYWVDRGSDPGVVLYLRGGGSCKSEAECAARYLETPEYTTQWGPNMQPGHGGILSHRQANPVGNWTKVYVGYCSSDEWLGDASLWGWEFRGLRIVESVWGELRMNRTISENGQVLLVGTSAGAVGASQLVDHLQELAPYANVRAILDSAAPRPPDWEPVPGPWNPYLDASCVESGYSGCMTGAGIRRYVSAPVFVYGDLYDSFFFRKIGLNPKSDGSYLEQQMELEAAQFSAITTTLEKDHAVATKPGYYWYTSPCDDGVERSYADNVRAWLEGDPHQCLSNASSRKR